MSTYAIIQVAGKQYKVSTGDVITVNQLDAQEGSEVTINDVLLVVNGDKTQVGTPVVNKASVVLKVVSHHKGDKVRVATYKAKSRYRKVKGHRQLESTLEVVSIS